ncbi:hypothetical protein ANN_01186 [Periplaneta americana]|uniref:Reverse transcriptase domain-containing protein n=1 Tax=Periplaneta americana TaxID=6978 RepID=A0ABQ8TUN0_PERAM|nr:hypothetical protein ANN_01186 [Periplaneta americana]
MLWKNVDYKWETGITGNSGNKRLTPETGMSKKKKKKKKRAKTVQPLTFKEGRTEAGGGNRDATSNIIPNMWEVFSDFAGGITARCITPDKIVVHLTIILKYYLADALHDDSVERVLGAVRSGNPVPAPRGPHGEQTGARRAEPASERSTEQTTRLATSEGEGSGRERRRERRKEEKTNKDGEGRRRKNMNEGNEMKIKEWGKNMPLGSHQLLVYADDVNMLGENTPTIRENTEILFEASKAIGLEVNPEKTKYMIMSRDQNIVRNGNIKIGDLSFEEVEKFKCLGATLRLPVVLYGCETWTLTLREEHRLRVFENKVLRKIFGAKWDEATEERRKLHNTELHALYSSPNIIRNLKSRRLRWAGHVARMGESRNAYRVLVGRPEGKRPLGRPRRRWEDNIKMDLREVGYDDRDWINLAQDRD